MISEWLPAHESRCIWKASFTRLPLSFLSNYGLNLVFSYVGFGQLETMCFFFIFLDPPKKSPSWNTFDSQSLRPKQKKENIAYPMVHIVFLMNNGAYCCLLLWLDYNELTIFMVFSFLFANKTNKISPLIFPLSLCVVNYMSMGFKFQR